MVNDDRFGFLAVGAGADESAPDLLTGVVSLGVVVSVAGLVGLGVPVAGAVVGPRPASTPAEESPVPNVDVCALLE